MPCTVIRDLALHESYRIVSVNQLAPLSVASVASCLHVHLMATTGATKTKSIRTGGHGEGGERGMEGARRAAAQFNSWLRITTILIKYILNIHRYAVMPIAIGCEAINDIVRPSYSCKDVQTTTLCNLILTIWPI